MIYKFALNSLPEKKLPKLPRKIPGKNKRIDMKYIHPK